MPYGLTSERGQKSIRRRSYSWPSCMCSIPTEIVPGTERCVYCLRDTVVLTVEQLVSPRGDVIASTAREGRARARTASARGCRRGLVVAGGILLGRTAAAHVRRPVRARPPPILEAPVRVGEPPRLSNQAGDALDLGSQPAAEAEGRHGGPTARRGWGATGAFLWVITRDGDCGQRGPTSATIWGFWPSVGGEEAGGSRPQVSR